MSRISEMMIEIEDEIIKNALIVGVSALAEKAGLDKNLKVEEIIEALTFAEFNRRVAGKVN